MMECFLAAFSTAGWIGALLFLGIYHRTSRWWEHGYGRALFSLGLVAFSFFTASMLYNIFGANYPGRLALRVFNLTLSVGMVWYLLITLLRSGAQARRDRWERVEESHASDGRN
jgi:hypothetical protein